MIIRPMMLLLFCPTSSTSLHLPGTFILPPAVLTLDVHRWSITSASRSPSPSRIHYILPLACYPNSFLKMLANTALFTLLASLAVVAEAAYIPRGTREQVLALARDNSTAVFDRHFSQHQLPRAALPKRRLVRRRRGKGKGHKGHKHDDEDDEDEDDNEQCGPRPSSSQIPEEPTPSSSWVEPTPSSSWVEPTPSSSWVEPSPSSSEAPSSTSSEPPAPTSTSSWFHVDTIRGSNFFDAQYWNWWMWEDPTHGFVHYVDPGTAWNEGLVSVNDKGQAIMKVETTEVVGDNGRKSVRIHSNRVWNGGMVLMDASHMPVGCGTWPAWWQNGPNWPEGGEIDILEGVNVFNRNQVSLHTGRGCTMPGDFNSNGAMSGSLLTSDNFNAWDCSSANTGNQGCGVADHRRESYGYDFNNIGGGVYALVWAKDGITAWFHPRYAIPEDISSGSPDPDKWGIPLARFPSTYCDPYKFFYDNFNIFDTTLCGDWAGGAWNYATGQDQSCREITGYETCQDYVKNHGSAFNDAYWEINYVQYYNSTTLV